jgi:hypothetical protein
METAATDTTTTASSRPVALVTAEDVAAVARDVRRMREVPS